MDKSVHNASDEQNRLETLQQELEGQELTALLERMQQQYDLSVNQMAVATGMDESALHKILRGENREFKAAHVDSLLQELEQQGKITDAGEIMVWKRALRVSAFIHYDLYKTIEPRIRAIEDVGKRIEALKTCLEEQYPALAETYDKTGGTFPLLLPLSEVAARLLQQKWGQERRVDYGTWQHPISPGSQAVGKQNSLFDERMIYVGGMPFVYIPAGKFLMGSQEDNPLARDDEKPQHTLYLPDFWMAQFPVTNAQYAEYVGIGTHPVEDWRRKAEHPVTRVQWRDAMAFCQWGNQQYRRELRAYGLVLGLPSEAQWEKAARGPYGNEWPWGDEFDPQKCNSWEGGLRGTTLVNAYPNGASPYGVWGMAGNVWEWTRSQYKAYPYEADDRESETGTAMRVLRGGSWLSSRYFARCAYRHRNIPDNFGNNLGFRLVLSPF